MFQWTIIRQYYDLLAIYFPYFYILLSFILVCLAFFGAIKPEKMHFMWKKWTESKYFSLYGVILIFCAFPLLHYTSTIIGKILFVIGILALLIGPFVVIYPEVFKQVMKEAEKELTFEEKRILVYADSVLRFIFAILLLYTFFFGIK